ncbi:MAG: hypothetical protein V8T86_00145 [Victivallis sp.]
MMQTLRSSAGFWTKKSGGRTFSSAPTLSSAATGTPRSTASCRWGPRHLSGPGFRRRAGSTRARPSSKLPRDAKFYSFDNPYYGLLNTGCHSINLLRFLAGTEPKVISASERGGAKFAELDFSSVTGTFEFCVNFNMRHWDEVTELCFGTRVDPHPSTPPPA